MSKFLDLFRKSASAINVLEGSLISGKVLKNERGFAWVEAGFRTPQAVPVSELGSKSAEVGEKLTFFLENIETPLGDMELDAKLMDSAANTEAVWNEIATAYQKNSFVKGRVLNAVNAGYAVGIGGVIAFLPASRVFGELRLGQLHDFKITAMGSGSPNRNLVVTCVEKADLDAILRSRARLAGSAAATEALLQKYSASRSVPRHQGTERKPREAVDTGALLARVQAMRMRKESAQGEGGAAAATTEGAEASSPAAGAKGGDRAALSSAGALRGSRGGARGRQGAGGEGRAGHPGGKQQQGGSAGEEGGAADSSSSSS